MQIAIMTVAGSGGILLVRIGRPNLSVVLLIGVWTLITTVGFPEEWWALHLG